MSFALRRRPVESVTVLPGPRYSLSATNLTRLFGETVALWNVDVEVRSGDLLAVNGANASGKTTLLRVLAGLATPTRGSVRWTTTSVDRPPRVAAVGHATHLFDELTALENVALAARLARRDEGVSIVLLDRLGVGPHAGQRVSALSAGTRRRVGLARALATDPDIVIVDEPFAGLDGSSADLVALALGAGRDEGRLLVVATHDDARTSLLATHTIWLEDGRVVRRTPQISAAMLR